MILVIDNYDSFTFNLVQYIKEIGQEVVVARNDEISVERIREIKPTHLILSPGPGNPNSAGRCLQVVREFYREIPIFGVCLGHQIIAQAFDGAVKKARVPMHGKVSFITHDQKGIFKELQIPLSVARYHSLIVESPLPDCLEITATTEEGEVMALRHKNYQVEGVQFHPESILTDKGLQMLRNFIENSKR